MQEMQVQSLDGADPLEKEMATHSSIIAWENLSISRGPGELKSKGSEELDIA